MRLSRDDCVSRGCALFASWIRRWFDVNNRIPRSINAFRARVYTSRSSNERDHFSKVRHCF